LKKRTEVTGNSVIKNGGNWKSKHRARALFDEKKN